jgi:hypothetical protein
VAILAAATTVASLAATTDTPTDNSRSSAFAVEEPGKMHNRTDQEERAGGHTAPALVPLAARRRKLPAIGT